MSPEVDTREHISLLHKKGSENFKCAIQAKNMGCFNASISRLYYSCLLVFKGCLIEYGDYNESTFKNLKGSSHKYIIDEYIDRLLPSLDCSDSLLMDVVNIRRLRDSRKDADYSSEIDYCSPLTNRKFENIFLCASKCLRALESIHSIKLIDDEEDDAE